MAKKEKVEETTTAQEEELQVPVLDISEEELEANQKNMEDAKKILTPPEGQVLAGLRSFCPIHGDITRASKILKHTIYMKNAKTGKIEPVSYSDVICLACVSELWRKNVVANYPKDKDGNPGEIKVSPVFIPREEYEKIVESQKVKAEEAQKETESTTAESKEETKTEEVKTSE